MSKQEGVSVDTTGEDFALTRISNLPMLPYDLADYCNGVGIYYACVNPTYFAEHAHPELQIAIPFNNASGLATWYTATGRTQVTGIAKQKFLLCIWLRSL